MTIITDSREQKPYKFPKSAKSVTQALDTGDYSLAGYEDKITIERKSKADAYGSLGSGRSRFKREILRMAKFDYAAVVIEASLEDFLIPPPYSQLKSKSAINSFISWSVKYGVHIFFAGNRQHGRTLTYRILEKWWKHKKEDV